MKKLIFSIATLAAAVGCSDLYTEESPVAESQASEAQTTYVKLNLSLEGENDSPETRVLVTEGEAQSDPWTVAWEAGDEIFVYSIDQEAYKTLTYDGESFSGDVYSGENRVYFNNSTYLNTSSAWWDGDGGRPLITISYAPASAEPLMVSSDVITIEAPTGSTDETVNSELEVSMKHLCAMIDFGMMFSGISSDLGIMLTYVSIGGVPEGGSADEYVSLSQSVYTDPALRYDNDDFYVTTDNDAYGSIGTVPPSTENNANNTEFTYIYGVRPFTLESGKKLSVTLEFNFGLFSKTFDITNNTGADFEFARATHSYIRQSYDLSDFSSEGLWIFDAVAFADQNSAGTADDPIEIASEEELAYLAAVSRYMTDDKNLVTRYCSSDAACHFKLTKDLNLSGKEWTPIGTDTNFSNYFNFDGDGHTITGLTIEQSGDYKGLFTNICGEVSNLNLVDVDVTGAEYVGGLAGVASGSAAIITNCTVSGSVTGESYVGGVAGCTFWGPQLIACGSSCSVTGTGSSGYTGGVVGCITNTPLTDCYNTGTVVGEGYAGGILGYTMAYAADLTITGCYNTGEVRSNGGYAGGIGGSLRYLSIDACYNTGNITGVGYAGGIAGYFSGGNSITAYLTNCYNTGDVSCCSADSYNNCRSGGIIGCSAWLEVIYNCYNTGDIYGAGHTGGISGYQYFSPITACYNVGEITKTTSSDTSGAAGGIYGYKPTSVVITESYYIVNDDTAFTNFVTPLSSVAELNAKVEDMNAAATTAGYTGTISYTAGGDDYTLPYLGIGGGEPFTYGDAGSTDDGSIEDLGDNGGFGSF